MALNPWVLLPELNSKIDHSEICSDDGRLTLVYWGGGFKHPPEIPKISVESSIT